jgi:signal transduction histidine kinase
VEAAADEANLALREELEERTAQRDELQWQLDVMKSELHDLTHRDQERADFVAMAAHDLRNPATVLAGLAFTLKAHWETFDDAGKAALIDRLAANADALHQLTEDLLEVAHIDAGKLGCRRDPFELPPVIEGCVDDIRLGMDYDNFILDVDDDLPLVAGDDQRTFQVLQNLITNAVKYGSTQSPVVVRAAIHRRSWVRVDISDAGPGISKSDVARLFQRFTRLTHQRRSGIKGTGLGLYIARNLIEAQGGEIWVDSRPGAGTTFSFTIPCWSDSDAP